jgi:adenosylcobinamide kinase/adenosylcobinamide-phosphate guanylyltransferase
VRTLVIGGARSGKSAAAESALAGAADVTYVATGYAADSDPEWADRVAQHLARRPPEWRTVETLDLPGLLDETGGPLLVDCLTLWLTRVMDRHRCWDDDAWAAGGADALAGEVEALIAALRATSRDVVLVTNEVGQGVVPDTASGRRFRDEMGRLNAAVARECGAVLWCVAGRVVRM